MLSREFAIGPATYVVNAVDLNTTFPGNLIVKYANDTCRNGLRSQFASSPARWAVVRQL